MSYIVDGERATRSKAAEVATACGMVVKRGVSKKLDFLVAADPDSQSSKAKKARQAEWAKQGMVGVDVFQEGIDILKRFVREEGALDSHDVLGLEKEIWLKVGRLRPLERGRRSGLRRGGFSRSARRTALRRRRTRRRRDRDKSGLG